MGRRDPDPRPPVEVWGAEPPPEGRPVRIEIGGRRARRVPLLIGAAVVALLVGGLALNGEDDGGGPLAEEDDDGGADREEPSARDRTSTTRRPASTTTSSTSTTVVAGPVLPVQTGAALLVSSSGDGWTWLELDTGLTREVNLRTTDPYALIPMRGGVATMRGASAEFQPLPEGEPVVLGPANQIVASGSPDTVWLIRSSFDGPTSEDAEAVLVDGRGRQLSGTVRLPAGYANGGTARGLVFSRSGRTYLAEESGIRPLAVGEALSTNASSVVVLACDDAAVCAPEIVDVATGRAHRFATVANAFEMGVSVTLSDGGDHLAVLTYNGRGQSLQVYDRDGRVVGAIDDLAVQNQIRWLPDDLGLVAYLADSGIAWISISADGARIEPIGAFERRYRDEFVFVIPR
jgi:hypothetical protein